MTYPAAPPGLAVSVVIAVTVLTPPTLVLVPLLEFAEVPVCVACEAEEVEEGEELSIQELSDDPPMVRRSLEPPCL